ncbi:phage baseplate assembly protein V [Sphingobium yanoikuyae]|uniref:phage baseplate assembly protein V n=1 Tax=Sphingobium yanoikuyae TaxID=13690 RepID=UPI0008475E17|nr:phage baseplate assembly protein V [Sphingobium yanoikuyae]
MSDAAGLDEMLRFGTIASLDLAAARCVVEIGDVLSTPIPWIEQRAGKTSTWSPPSVGEQVILLCPGGDLAAGVVMRGIYSDAMPAPGNSLRELIRYKDGAEISYDPETHALEVNLPDGANVTIVAQGGIGMIGDLYVSGTIHASDDVVTNGISLKNHKHAGVQAVAAQTSAPL